MAPTAPVTPSVTNRPLSIKEIVSEAENFKWDPNIRMRFWLQTANTLLQEANSYLNDGNFAQAYLLYMRYATLVMTHLPNHPDAKTPEEKKALNGLMKSVQDVMTNLENIKPLIERDFEAWLSESKKRSHRNEETGLAKSKSKSSTYQERASRDPALSSSSRLLDAADNVELAVEFAHREFQRRDAKRKATSAAGGSHKRGRSKRDAGLWDNFPSELADRQAEDEELFRRNMEAMRRTLDGKDSEVKEAITNSGASYRYPSISQSQPIQYEAQQAYNKRSAIPQPPRPPKEEILYRREVSPDRTLIAPVPRVPAKVRISPERILPTPETSQELPTPPPKIREDAPAPGREQQRLTFKPAAYLESGEPIRSFFLPSQLRHKFLSIASENTRRGLEMCGILCGTAVKNALFVRCLLIPEQKCTSDTCETENEGSMLEYCMNEDLLILGWIHTHPTQTCFMSSRDLHTQAGYQVMLPESIAIVCAPNFEPDYGIFRLTKPPGLDHILSCSQTATFHPHSVDNLYTNAESPPGHVYETPKLGFTVHDLRPGARNSTAQHKNF